MNNLDLFEQLPDGILFDTDNTLYSYDPANKAGIEAVRKKVSQTFSISEDQFDQAYRQARKEVKALLGETAASHSRLLYIQKMLENLGFGSQVLLALDLEQTYWRTFLHKAELFDDVTEFLDDLRLLGIPSVIVTDLTAQIQFRKIVYFGLDHFFDYIVTSEEAGFDKPHKAPFNIAIDKMNVAGKRYWMIGDNPINDIQGAKEAINAITLQKYHKGVVVGEGKQQPDLVFKEFGELRSIVKKISKKQESK